MTVTQQPPGTPHGPGGSPAWPPRPANYDWSSAQAAPTGQRRRNWVPVAIAAIGAMSLAALVVGLIAITKPSPASTNQAAAAAGADTTAADTALCNAIAPLMADNDRFSNAYVDSGEPGTPARDAATPKFIDETLKWIDRAQPLLDQHPDIDPYFRRSLQRFIDDRHLLVVDLRPGPLTSYAKALYADSVGAYSGPLHLCDGLGIKW